MEQVTAVLLMAHGSRRQAANRDLFVLAGQLAARGVYSIVEAGFLELAEPTIAEGGRRCAQRGATCVKMLPYFLSAGTHVASDLGEIRQALESEFPGVSFELCPHLGLHPLMLDIVMDRLAGSTTGLVASNETTGAL